MVFQDSVESPGHDPVKLGFRKTETQRVKDRQPVDDIAKRAWLYDEDLTGV
jgi:hypothetical protein